MISRPSREAAVLPPFILRNDTRRYSHDYRFLGVVNLSAQRLSQWKILSYDTQYILPVTLARNCARRYRRSILLTQQPCASVTKHRNDEDDRTSPWQPTMIVVSSSLVFSYCVLAVRRRAFRADIRQLELICILWTKTRSVFNQLSDVYHDLFARNTSKPRN